MKDHFIDDRALAAEFDDEALQFDNAEPSPLLWRKAIGRLVVGLQHKLAFRIQRHAMRRRATLEIPTHRARKAASVQSPAARRTNTISFTIGSSGVERLTMLPSRSVRKVMASLSGSRRSGTSGNSNVS